MHKHLSPFPCPVLNGSLFPSLPWENTDGGSILFGCSTLPDNHCCHPRNMSMLLCCFIHILGLSCTMGAILKSPQLLPWWHTHTQRLWLWRLQFLPCIACTITGALARAIVNSYSKCILSTLFLLVYACKDALSCPTMIKCYDCHNYYG